MNATPTTQPFPCPFCQSSRVVLLGGGLVFLHYECAECAEVWTAMAARTPSVVRPKSAAPRLTLHVTRKEKLWPN
jgi:transposase-like protein